MTANAIISAANYRRIHRARTWLECRAAAEEVLDLDASNELARRRQAENWRNRPASTRIVPLTATIAALLWQRADLFGSGIYGVIRLSSYFGLLLTALTWAFRSGVGS